METQVKVFEDGVYIYDHNGVEIVSWTEDEWEQDPSVVASIANALVIFYTEGEYALKVRTALTLTKPVF